MSTKLPPRLRNFFYMRQKLSASEELPWIRVPKGLDRMTFSGPVVLVNGAFDLLHSGHMKVLFAARHKAGDMGTVVCAMDSDKKIAGRKGKGRPILSWVERAAALAYMPIDHLVEIETDEEMKRLVELVRPDLRVLGDEYLGKVSRFPKIPVMYVVVRGMSTGKIVERVRGER